MSNQLPRQASAASEPMSERQRVNLTSYTRSELKALYQSEYEKAKSALIEKRVKGLYWDVINANRLSNTSVFVRLFDQDLKSEFLDSPQVTIQIEELLPRLREVFPDMTIEIIYSEKNPNGSLKQSQGIQLNWGT